MHVQLTTMQCCLGGRRHSNQWASGEGCVGSLNFTRFCGVFEDYGLLSDTPKGISIAVQ